MPVSDTFQTVSRPRHRTPPEDEIAVAVLLHLSESSGVRLNLLDVRRVVAAEFSSGSVPHFHRVQSHGTDEEQATNRLLAAGRALGLPMRVVRLQAKSSLKELAGWRAAVACVEPMTPRWVMVKTEEGQTTCSWIAESPSGTPVSEINRDPIEVRTARLKEVQNSIASTAAGTVSWVVLDTLVKDGGFTGAPVDSGDRIADIGQGNGHHGGHGGAGGGHGGGHHAHAHPTPLGRLQGLIRAEWSDVWIVLVFSLVVGLLTLATPVAVEALVNTVAFGQFLQPVVILSLILFAFLLFAATLRALQVYVVEIIQRRMFVRLSGVLAWRLPRVHHESIYGQSLRELTNRFFEIATVQKAAATLLLDGLSLLLGSLVGMAVLAFYHPWLLGFDLVLLALVALTVFTLGRGAVPSAIRESRAKYATAAWLEQVANASLSFKTGAGAELAMARTDALVTNYLSCRMTHFRVILRQSLFALFLQALASTVLLGLGGWLVIKGQLTLGQLVASELIVTIIVGSFAKLGKHMEGYYDLVASLDKIGHLIDLAVERPSGAVRMAEGGAASVTLKSVSYAYEGESDHPALSHVSVEVPPGAALAVMGPPGSGKSTLLDLLYGLRGPQGGRIAIDGVDVRDIQLDSLRRNVRLVRGEEVFEGTVLDNLLMGRAAVLPGDVDRALEDVGLQQKIRSLPEGSSSQLKETGAPLSRGQLARLALARALIGNPRLLLLDGALDQFADDEQERVLERLRLRDMTIVLVTGRESLASRCGEILRLDDE